MPGHMQQRGSSTWRLHAFAGKDSNGRKRYTSKTFHGTKKQAGVALAAFVTEVAKERTASSPTEAITVSQTLSKWLNSRKAQLSPATTDRYRVAIKHVEPVIGSMRVSRLRPHHIEDLYSAVVAEGQSGSSIRKIHWALRQSLAWAHRRGYVSIIATDGVELPPLGAREMEPPSSDDVRTVIEYLLATDADRVLPSLPGPVVAGGSCRTSLGRRRLQAGQPANPVVSRGHSGRKPGREDEDR
jgi:integrase